MISIVFVFIVKFEYSIQWSVYSIMVFDYKNGEVCCFADSDMDCIIWYFDLCFFLFCIVIP